MMKLISCAIPPTAALVEREDVIVVASVSCIYGLGDPEEYYGMMLSLRPGMRRTGMKSCALWWKCSMNAMI